MIIVMLFIQMNLRLIVITDALKWVIYLNLHLEFDEDGKRYRRLYDKRDDWFPDSKFSILK